MYVSFTHIESKLGLRAKDASIESQKLIIIWNTIWTQFCILQVSSSIVSEKLPPKASIKDQKAQITKKRLMRLWSRLEIRSRLSPVTLPSPLPFSLLSFGSPSTWSEMWPFIVNVYCWINLNNTCYNLRLGHIKCPKNETISIDCYSHWVWSPSAPWPLHHTYLCPDSDRFYTIAIIHAFKSTWERISEH